MRSIVNWSARILALGGRLAIRDGGKVALACFILLGAPIIAAALLDLGHGVSGAQQLDIAVATPDPIIGIPQTSYDPYAGASLPTD